MRLTLRTLLAYLDDVLDSADKEELGKKIESSEFAMDLVHRTKDTMRRLRLSAPQPIGTGMGLDPNTVAEYLDNVMPPESVGDFERICLESDMHLAEVASCHHVLTMVLGQPADIDPAAKQRMYTLPTELAERKRLRVERAHMVGGSQSMVQAAPMGAAALTPAAAKHLEIPEYLRPTGWARYRSLLLGLAAVLVVGASLYFFGAFDRWFAKEAAPVAIAPPVEINVPAPNTFAQTSPPVEPATEPVAQSPASPTQGAPTSTGPHIVESGIASAPNGNPSAIESSGPAVGSPDSVAVAATAPTEVAPLAAPAETVGGDAPARMEAGGSEARLAGPRYAETQQQPTSPPQDEPAAGPTTENPTTAAVANLPTPPQPSAPVHVDPDGTVRVADAGLATGPAATANGSAVPEEPEPPKVLELGTYRGGKSVLLRFDEAAGAWLRVPPRSPVVKGERLVALPEFRPMVPLANGVHMDLLGGTMVTLDMEDGGAAIAGGTLPSAGADSPPTIDVSYGRVVLINTLGEERGVRLAFGATKGEARLAQNATLAIEVEHKFVPGNDPRRKPTPVTARLYVPDGGVVWKDASGEMAIDKPSEWTIADGVPTAVVSSSSPPTWIDPETVAQSSEQRYAAPVVEGALASNRPADVQLLELFQGTKKRELQSLVARSCAHVGLYVPFVEALRDSAQKPNWDSHIQSLRAAMAMSPEAAERIRRTLVEQRGEAAGADLYEMLCGYNADQVGRTPEQVKTGAIARLIGWLDEDSLDYRVLAKYNLAEITGKQLMPNPAGSLSERKLQIKKWRSRLDSGELMPAKSAE